MTFNRLTHIFAALATAVSLNAANPLTLTLWPDGMPNSNETKVSAQDSIEWNIVDTPVLHIYDAGKPGAKVVLLLPGGGYRHLGVENEGHAFARWYNDNGISAAMLQYRMPNGHHEVPLSDVHQAMRTLRQYYPDSKIGVQGFSAGGHLASTAATHYSDSFTRPDFQILFYPVVAMSEPNTHRGSRTRLLGENPDETLIELYDNHKRVTSDTPPALLFHSSDDSVVPVANSLDYYKALVENGVSASLHIYPIGEHGWGFAPGFAYWSAWTTEILNWLKHN